MEMLDTLQTNLDNSNFSMKNIADSTEMTAESIQTQASIQFHLCFGAGFKGNGIAKEGAEGF